MIKDDMLALFNQMYRDGKILEQQKHGTVVFIPKNIGLPHRRITDLAKH